MTDTPSVSDLLRSLHATPSERRAVERAALRCCAFERWRENGIGQGNNQPGTNSFGVTGERVLLQVSTGARWAALASIALIRAAEMSGRQWLGRRAA